MSEHHEQHHELSYKEPILVFLGLVILTLLTVGLAGLNVSATVSLLIAFSIASFKSTLVARYFMHLKYEDRLFTIFLGCALGTFAVVFILMFSDYSFRW